MSFLKEDRMLLKVDKNTHKITGEYDTTTNDRKNATDSTYKSYPVKVVNNKIVFTKDVRSRAETKNRKQSIFDSKW